MKKSLSISEYTNGITSGNRMILSRAITLIESNLEEDKQLAQDVLESILPFTGKSIRIGITGVPGVGKSTFIETFGKYLTTENKKIAVLAIDPSSQLTKGSILGDKTRMEELAHEPLAYIRPSPTGASLGGVTHKTRETMLLCEAAGFEVVIIETVGVGQSETYVHGMVDFFLLLMLAGAGDELQGIKKGIMEMADLIAITKADSGNELQANVAKNEYGLIGNEANAIAPNKRMLSSMTPTIVEENGKLKMILGTPGGSTIITSVFQVFLNVIEHGMTMQQAVDAFRFHHQWLPDRTTFEDGGFTEQTLKRMREKGYKIDAQKNTIGRMDCILVLPDGTYEGGSDVRADDTSIGY